ncbi:PREDICTED: uncharacterized protein LOC106809785 [Priapulus caudatus]|uniref:Uncharacterized protein LOC106809785 n=1 Tax=Priapulus caudatus TaxID=37621 RepID=A0ABM1E8F4_PRICU|nr:PREDICTED: uncharacterized protein LOC106809785 [Priapulus caudatus]
MVIGRDTKQWRACLALIQGDDTCEMPPLSNPKTQKPLQLYAPLQPPPLADSQQQQQQTPQTPSSSSSSLSTTASAATTAASCVGFVPRQRLLILTVRDKQVRDYIMLSCVTSCCYTSLHHVAHPDGAGQAGGSTYQP